MGKYTTTAKKEYSTDVCFVIIADRHTIGLKKFGPKSEIVYRNQTILSHQINAIKTVIPTAEIVVVVGMDREKIIAQYNGVRFIENPFYETFGESESFRLALNATTSGKVCLVMGNVVINPNDIKLMTVENSVSVANKTIKGSVGIIEQNGIALSMTYKSNQTWNGMLYIEKELIEELKYKLRRSSKQFEIHEVVNEIIPKCKVVRTKTPMIESLADLV